MVELSAHRLLAQDPAEVQEKRLIPSHSMHDMPFTYTLRRFPFAEYSYKIVQLPFLLPLHLDRVAASHDISPAVKIVAVGVMGLSLCEGAGCYDLCASCT